MYQTIDVLVVEPGKEPRLTTVVDDMEHLQEIVGGPIEVGCSLPQRVMLICNGEGKNTGLPPNRVNPNGGGNLIFGTFLLCSFEGERFASLNAEQQARFKAYFALPRMREDIGR